MIKGGVVFGEQVFLEFVKLTVHSYIFPKKKEYTTLDFDPREGGIENAMQCNEYRVVYIQSPQSPLTSRCFFLLFPVIILHEKSSPRWLSEWVIAWRGSSTCLEGNQCSWQSIDLAYHVKRKKETCTILSAKLPRWEIQWYLVTWLTNKSTLQSKFCVVDHKNQLPPEEPLSSGMLVFLFGAVA